MSLLIVSYAVAALAYGALLALLLLSRRAVRRGEWVMAAVAGGAVWGLVIVAALTRAQDEAAFGIVFVADALRALLWIVCLLMALPGLFRSVSFKGAAFATALLLAAFTVADYVYLQTRIGTELALLALSILGCLVVEQIFRNTPDEDRIAVRGFLWAIGAILLYDLFVFSNAVLLGRVNIGLWALRGVVAALGVPFMLLSAKRHPDWAQTLFISREVVFYSATLTGLGFYLLAMALGGFVIRQLGGGWGAAVQAVYLVGAFAVLAFIFSSSRWKNRLRVFISKHFYRNRYDYREEWLRLIRTLSDETQDLALDERSIKALCGIIDSSGGQMWLHLDPGSRYEPFAAWQAEFPSAEYADDFRLVRFLRENRWVIDSREYREDPERYQHAFRDDPVGLPDDSIIVPLFHQKEMLGFVRLNASQLFKTLNYEDHDLLKTAGRQVAAFLAHDIAREKLAETQKFEAYNKFSAFVMHDLKNLLAQQALLVENAKKYQGRPEFIADMIKTVENGVQRMRRLLRQLNQGVPFSQNMRIDLNKAIAQAVAACAGNTRVPCTFTEQEQAWVSANGDQLTSVLIHIIQNAQEATADGTAVDVALSVAPDGRAEIEVRDSGEGMSEEFVRKRLFKPFATTKGVSGMGIGVYQAREIVRGLGGDIAISSGANAGTTVRIVLPLIGDGGQETSAPAV